MSERTKTGVFAKLSGALQRLVDAVTQLGRWVLSITVKRPPSRCAEIPDLTLGHKPNPVTCNAFTLTASGPTGQLMIYPGRTGPETLVKQQEGIRGFDAASRIETRFPAGPSVIVRAAHFGQPATIEAFEATGALAGMELMDATAGVEQGFTFTGSAIDRVVVTPSGDTIVIEFCH